MSYGYLKKIILQGKVNGNKSEHVNGIHNGFTGSDKHKSSHKSSSKDKHRDKDRDHRSSKHSSSSRLVVQNVLLKYFPFMNLMNNFYYFFC